MKGSDEGTGRYRSPHHRSSQLCETPETRFCFRCCPMGFNPELRRWQEHSPADELMAESRFISIAEAYRSFTSYLADMPASMWSLIWQ